MWVEYSNSIHIFNYNQHIKHTMEEYAITLLKPVQGTEYPYFVTEIAGLQTIIWKEVHSTLFSAIEEEIKDKTIIYPIKLNSTVRGKTVYLPTKKYRYVGKIRNR